jgi:hypothetical protein
MTLKDVEIQTYWAGVVGCRALDLLSMEAMVYSLCGGFRLPCASDVEGIKR